ncbi:MAG: hypothetical protein IKZ88_06470 [Neisseriaceae bacterium]|nr:hypothetical protein [Neisseriaceae bacterium]
MKIIQLIALSFCFLSLSACSSYHGNAISLDKQLSKVDENHHEMVIDGNKIVLDSYIKLFQRPYYIVLKSEKPIMQKEAEQIAVEYIQPRGCTTPIKRRPDLDKNNTNKTQWLIGVEC